MADELTVTVGFAYDKSSSAFAASLNDLGVDVTATTVQHSRRTIGGTEEALFLGTAASGGLFLCINRSTTGNISIRQGTGTTDLISLRPGEVCMFRFNAATSAPYAIGTSSSPQLEYWLLGA